MPDARLKAESLLKYLWRQWSQNWLNPFSLSIKARIEKDGKASEIRSVWGAFGKRPVWLGLSSKLHPSLIPREKRQNYHVSERGSEDSSKNMMFFLKRQEGTFMGVTEIRSYVAESAWRCCTKIHAQSLTSSQGRWHEITLDSVQVD